MSANTSIEWTDRTWNPVRGCALVSDGCRNCYAMKQAHRFSGPGKPYEGLTEIGPAGPRWTGRVRLVPEALDEPLRWRKPQRIFVNSMSDLFHEDVPEEFIDRVFAVMALAPRHMFQILTKRPARMLAYLCSPGLSQRVAVTMALRSRCVDPPGIDDLANARATHHAAVVDHSVRALDDDELVVLEWEIKGMEFERRRFSATQREFEREEDGVSFVVSSNQASLLQSHARSPGEVLGDRHDASDGPGIHAGLKSWPLPNVWLGVSAENQKTADDRIPLLLQTPAAVRFVSAEPLLGSINLNSIRWETQGAGGPAFVDVCGGTFCTIGGHGLPGPKLDWVIVGGESGAGARPCEVSWFRSIVEQCRAADVAVFVKQLGKWPSSDRPERVGRATWMALRNQSGETTHWAPWSGGSGKCGDPSEWPEDLRVREFPREAVAATV
jgi:protein gp37